MTESAAPPSAPRTLLRRRPGRARQAGRVAVLRHRRWTGGRFTDTWSAPTAIARADRPGRAAAGDDRSSRSRPSAARSSPESVLAHVDRRAAPRDRVQSHATHLLHAALRRLLGRRVSPGGGLRRSRQATASTSRTQQDFAERRSGGRARATGQRMIFESAPVRAITTTLTEAKRLGAMALFGEKYGDVVRMVRGRRTARSSAELCGAAHVTAPHLRDRAVQPGRDPLEHHRDRPPDRGRHGSRGGSLRTPRLGSCSQTLRVPPERVADTVVEAGSGKKLERARRGRAARKQLAVAERSSRFCATFEVKVPDGKALLDVAPASKAARRRRDRRLLVTASEDRVEPGPASVAQSLVSQGARGL